MRRQPPHPKKKGRKERSSPRPRRRRDEGPPRDELLSGVLAFERDGSARLVPDREGQPRVYVPPEDLQGFADGDAVTVRLELGRKARLRGRIVARGLRRHGDLVGIVHQTAGEWLLIPEPEGPPLVLAPEDRGAAAVGDAVAARISDFGRGPRLGRATVTEVLGRPGDPRVQVELLVRGQGLPRLFEDGALAEAEAAPAVRPAELLRAEPDRHDLRDVPHVTIDGEDARDFDDAVSARTEERGVRVWVSIADVSHYVRSGTALDDAARERGTSVYFPHKAIPMLPERLSNGLCSLVPGEPRLTLTCELRVKPDGHVEDVSIYPSLIQSASRLTYTQVQMALDGKGGPADLPMLPELAAASRALRARRKQRGSVDLDLPEAQVLLDPTGVAVHVRERARLEAHRLIEDLMIAANEAVAETLLARGWPAVFRIHEPPDPERLATLARWASTLGLHLDTDAARKPNALAKLATTLAGRAQGTAGLMLLLRSMAQARYSDENLGHYGLASRAYLHFTSPIRRYPDLLVHRALRALWQGREPEVNLEAEAARCSLQERRAAQAERNVAQLMACHVAEHHLGEVFDAMVTGVHQAGAFVRVKEPWVEGLVPISTLGELTQDYYDVVLREHALVGRRSGHRVALGDVLTVRLTSVSTYRRQIDFELARPPVITRSKPAVAAVAGAGSGEGHPRRPWVETLPSHGPRQRDSRDERRSGRKAGRSSGPHAGRGSGPSASRGSGSGAGRDSGPRAGRGPGRQGGARSDERQGSRPYVQPSDRPDGHAGTRSEARKGARPGGRSSTRSKARSSSGPRKGPARGGKKPGRGPRR